jgi:hypothetical protein
LELVIWMLGGVLVGPWEWRGFGYIGVGLGKDIREGRLSSGLIRGTAIWTNWLGSCGSMSLHSSNYVLISNCMSNFRLFNVLR